MRAHPDDDDATWNYDPTAGSDDTENEDDEDEDKENDEDADSYYYGYGCLIVSTGPKLPIAAAFTQRKQVDEETAKRVTCDALAVETPIWMLGDGGFDILEWHDDLVDEAVVPVAPYNPRNTDDPLDIEYRIEDRIENHTDDVHLKQSVLEETYNRRTQVERTIGASKDCGLGTPRVHVKTHVFLALCLRLAIAIANYERGANPGKTSVEV